MVFGETERDEKQVRDQHGGKWQMDNKAGLEGSDVACSGAWLHLCMSGWLAPGLENHSTVVYKVVNVANTKL